jgi:PhzF family phenazine biosynthesis protein
MRTAYPYQKIDAFTSGASLGNPAACLYLAEGQRLTDGDMLAIAAQHKGFVSEVVYCALEGSKILLTYYSSECEVEFCGHGTIACMHGLIRARPDLLARKEIQIETRRKGPLMVYNRIPEQDAVFIAAPAPVHLGTHLEADEIEAALGARPHPGLPIDCINAGLNTLIVPLEDLNTEVSIFPDERRLKAFCGDHGIDIVLVYSIETARPDSIAHTRVFAPKFGYLEDPATGSGNSAFGYYMLKNGLWDGADLSVEQGGKDRAFNEVRLSRADGQVLFGGSATVRIVGEHYWETGRLNHAP